MPKREAFEFEHDNDAEQLISELVFSDGDTAEETALKFKILE